eukprot:CAMPEP_0179145748 /NCGR_PEP_ID=MMETSP0796-20121207/70340_1 /TAXON_ID=73915 /ORGANISM="Pyrodinium bahamense, Strain pbaha01" /LENGTH=359 /DNA_ID=CAMNT_0020846169 /DNA_START=1 /DNA_END=1079 /DNA_ORIENTATION=+
MTSVRMLAAVPLRVLPPVSRHLAVHTAGSPTQRQPRDLQPRALAKPQPVWRGVLGAAQQAAGGTDAGVSSSRITLLGGTLGSGGGLIRIRTASCAFSSERHFFASVQTDRTFIQGVPAALTLSARAKSRSSRATQEVTSGWSFSHLPISRARRSHHAMMGWASAISGFGVKIGVKSLKAGISWLFITAPMDDLKDSVRLHSEESTIVAAVCCTMERKLPSAATAKSLSLTVSRTGSATPSKTTVSTLPTGRSTPSMSRKMTLVLSSGGSFGLVMWFLAAATLAAASLAGLAGAGSHRARPTDPQTLLGVQLRALASTGVASAWARPSPLPAKCPAAGMSGRTGETGPGAAGREAERNDW